jgi:hypothetical protein
MDPKRFLDVARRLLTRSAEEDWRTAANRAYYSLMIPCRDALSQWGFVAPKADAVHQFVRSRFYLSSYPDLTPIGTILNHLSHLRNQADYEMSSLQFKTVSVVRQAVLDADDGLKQLDALQADAAKLAAAIAAIRKRFP